MDINPARAAATHPDGPSASPFRSESSACPLRARRCSRPGPTGQQECPERTLPEHGQGPRSSVRKARSQAARLPSAGAFPRCARTRRATPVPLLCQDRRFVTGASGKRWAASRSGTSRVPTGHSLVGAGAEGEVSWLRTSRTGVSRHAGLMSHVLPDGPVSVQGHVESPAGHHCRHR